MMNKKLVGTALVGLMTVGFAAQVSAAQTIDGREGDTEGKINVTGNLGEIDNTDPGEVIPDGDDKWINVTLPTAVVFGTTDKTNITSVDYVMTNNSGRPVDVSVKEYKLKDGEGIPALQELNLVKKVDGKTVALAADGASLITGTEAPTFFDKIDSKGTTTFKFGGKIDSSKLPSEGQAKVHSDLVLKFKTPLIAE